MSSANENPFISALSEDAATGQSQAHLRRFSAGQVIFSAGDPGNGFYVVESGQVRISAPMSAGGERVLARIGPGDFFGEMAIVEDAPRSATATAETDAITVFLGRDTLLQLIERRPQLALYIIREFSLRMRALNQKYLDDMLQAERLGAIGKFARTIVHDIKNPLTVIGLAAEVSAAETATQPMRDTALNRITRQIDRISNMLQELIDFTRPVGQSTLLQPADFAAFMAPLLEEVAQEMRAREVKLVAEPVPAQLQVRMEPRRLARLFFNLVNNALDEMRGGGTLYVRFRIADGQLTIEVEDTGKGIAPEIAGSLFEPFATHGKTHGSGLGLTICRKIVEDHGGQIRARSEPGKGATFLVTLPVAAA